jgi:hypothetical protein
MALSQIDENKIKLGTQEFLNKLTLIAPAHGGQSASEIIEDLTNEAGQDRYAELFAELAEGPFRESLETIISTEGQGTVEILLAAGGNARLRTCLFRAFHRRICG